MPAQTESLIKLIAGTSSGRGKATQKIANFAYKRTTDSHDYKMRANQVNIGDVSKDGATLRIQLPAFNALVGEQWLQVDFPEMQGNATYDPHVGAKFIRSARLIHSDKAYECEPERVWPVLLSCIRDEKQKANHQTKTNR